MATHSSILGLGDTMDREAWWATIHGVTRFKDDLVAKLPAPPYKIIPIAFMKKPGENLRHYDNREQMLIKLTWTL